ncbi:MAG: hypothetical protein KDB96_12200 [Flavobacteriales bacterium]|nr:hypothetical protein [Flavobacteriales bacterium]
MNEQSSPTTDPVNQDDAACGNRLLAAGFFIMHCYDEEGQPSAVVKMPWDGRSIPKVTHGQCAVGYYDAEGFLIHVQEYPMSVQESIAHHRGSSKECLVINQEGQKVLYFQTCSFENEVLSDVRFGYVSDRRKRVIQ